MFDGHLGGMCMLWWLGGALSRWLLGLVALEYSSRSLCSCWSSVRCLIYYWKWGSNIPNYYYWVVCFFLGFFQSLLCVLCGFFVRPLWFIFVIPSWWISFCYKMPFLSLVTIFILNSIFLILALLFLALQAVLAKHFTPTYVITPQHIVIILAYIVNYLLEIFKNIKQFLKI